MSELMTVEEARGRIVSQFQPVETTSAAIASALGRVLCQDIYALYDLPPFTNSSMDGFAVKAADTLTATENHPVLLRVVTDIPAGTRSEKLLTQGTAARIMTGAALPDGADAVIPIEETGRPIDGSLPEEIPVYRSIRSGEYLRPKGQDISKGQLILEKGLRIGPFELGLLATLGIAKVPVYRLPRVALLSSGDELVDIDTPLKPGKIHDANTYTLSGLLQQWGAEIIPLGIASDDPQDIDQRLQSAIEQGADVILTSAGVSVGAFDYVRSVIENKGRLDFWRVNMRPGKPLAFGSYVSVPLIGLPGNPVSAIVGSIIFVQPVLMRLSGLPDKPPVRLKATLIETIDTDGRETYFRAVVKPAGGKLQAALSGNQSSANLVTLVQANALLIAPSGVKSLPVGEEVEIILLKEIE